MCVCVCERERAMGEQKDYGAEKGRKGSRIIRCDYD